MPRRRCPQAPLCRYADPLVKDLKRLVPAALKDWDTDAIHDARVATRRLRAVIDLIEPILDDDNNKGVAQLRRTLRRLRGRLGPLRDLDVMLDLVQPYTRHAKYGPGASWLAEQLRAERETVRRKTQKKAAPAKWMSRLDEWQSIRRSVIALDDGVQRRLAISLKEQWHDFAARADRLSASLLLLDGAGDNDGERARQDPHELRIGGKNLRYTIEMTAETRGRLPAVVKRTFKRMQDELGLWHDHVVLTETAMRHSLRCLLAHHDPQLQARVLAVSNESLRAAERRLRRFAKLWRERGPTLASLVTDHRGARAGGDDDTTLTSPQTDPGLFDSPAPQAPEPPAPGEPSAA
jgi:CHAD domain-containing protein